MKNAAAIVQVGMTTPVGLNTVQTVSSVQSGISRIQELDLLDNVLDPVVIGYLPRDVLPDLDKSLPDRNQLTCRQQRMLRLASMALQEAAVNIPEIKNVPLLLAMPRPNNQREFSIKTNFFENLVIQSEVEFDIKESQLFELGRAGFFWALEKALYDMLRRKRDRPVMVGGVDTYLDPYLLASLLEEGRLLRPGVSNGLRPGEGACFMLLSSIKHCQKKKITPMAALLEVGKGMEQGHRYSDKPYRGEGLAKAFEKLFGRIQGRQGRIETVFAGFNGEDLAAKEWGVAFLRNRDEFTEEVRLEHPAEYLGDAGAALAPVMCACAAVGLHKGLVKGPVLFFASSDEAERGAACMVSNTI